MNLDDLSELGRIAESRVGNYWPHPHEIQLRLHRLATVYELDASVCEANNAAPADCIHIGKDLTCSANGIRFPIKILTWPIAVWTGRGKYRKKAVEIVELIVDNMKFDADAFCVAAKKGWAYEGRRRKRTSEF